jgi:hypothetical protein
VRSDQLTAAVSDWASIIKANAMAEAREVKKPCRDDTGRQENTPQTDQQDPGDQQPRLGMDEERVTTATPPGRRSDPRPEVHEH